MMANVKTKFSSETAWPNGAKLGRKHLCKILYKTSSFNSIRPTNMAAVTKNRTYGKIAHFITPRRVIRFTTGHVDLDMLHMFAV
jgi:hypothetical protein